MIDQFLTDFDKDFYENVFLSWDKDMRQKAEEKINRECDKITILLSSAKNIDDLRYEFNPEASLINNKIISDVFIENINTRFYNKHPSIYVPVDLNKMVLSLSDKLHKQKYFMDYIFPFFENKN